MNSPYRSLCTKFIIYAIILYGYQIVRRSFFMAPKRVISRENCNFPCLSRKFLMQGWVLTIFFLWGATLGLSTQMRSWAQSHWPNPVVLTFILFSQAPESKSLVDDNADNDEERVFKVAVFNQVEN